jgi:hypothetical protein
VAACRRWGCVVLDGGQVCLDLVVSGVQQDVVGAQEFGVGDNEVDVFVVDLRADLVDGVGLAESETVQVFFAGVSPGRLASTSL